MPDKQTAEKLAPIKENPEPRWPVAVATIAAAVLHSAMPGALRLGPYWFVSGLVVVLVVSTTVAHRTGRYTLNHALGHIVSGLLTLSMIWSLTFLILGLSSHRDSPQLLLRSAASLWVSNFLVFAFWYWRLDAGGPNARDRRAAHTEGAFLFPQMAIPGKQNKNWSPSFVDYLFIAFNTSTAFSPTDVPVLSRWAKGLMITQSSISLVTVALIAARAVNIL